MKTRVALPRGINVGGQNAAPMKELKTVRRYGGFIALDDPGFFMMRSRPRAVAAASIAPGARLTVDPEG